MLLQKRDVCGTETPEKEHGVASIVETCRVTYLTCTDIFLIERSKTTISFCALYSAL